MNPWIIQGVMPVDERTLRRCAGRASPIPQTGGNTSPPASIRCCHGAISRFARSVVSSHSTRLAFLANCGLAKEAIGALNEERFHPCTFVLAATAGLIGDEDDAPGLILQGKRLLDAGKTNEAERELRSALELDPANEVARNYLTKMGCTNLPPATAHIRAPPISRAIARTRSGQISEAKKSIILKLDTIRLDSVTYDRLPLSEVIQAINKEALTRDPDKKGINFILSATADPQATDAPRIDFATGLPMEGGADIGTTTIRIVPPQQNITLRQLLDDIVLVADQPIQYSITDFGVLITQKDLRIPRFHTLLQGRSRHFRMSCKHWIRGF